MTMTAPTPADRRTPPPIDTFGCAFSRLATSQTLVSHDLRFHRKRSEHSVFGKVETLAEDRGFLIGVSLAGNHRRRILHARGATTYDFCENGIYVRDFADDYRAELSGSFDFVLLEVPGHYLEKTGAQLSRTRVHGLMCPTARRDDVLGHLVRAMVPAFDHAGEAMSALFVEQLGVAIGTHLIQRYGDVRASASTSISTL